MTSIVIRTKLSRKQPPLYHVYNRKQLWNFYYDMRSKLQDSQSRKVVRYKITGKEYTRRVDRINAWFDYKIETRTGDLVAAEIMANGKDNDEHRWFKV